MAKPLIYGATKVDDSNPGYAAVESLEPFQWKSRVLVIFSDSGNAKASRQENMLLEARDGLAERDLVILRLHAGKVAPLFGSGERLSAAAIAKDVEGPKAGEFAAVLVGKDGTVKLRVAEPISADELFAILDSMPMRAAQPGPQD